MIFVRKSKILGLDPIIVDSVWDADVGGAVLLYTFHFVSWFRFDCVPSEL